jgi:hypothetical protein
MLCHFATLPPPKREKSFKILKYFLKVSGNLILFMRNLKAVSKKIKKYQNENIDSEHIQ